ncbi:hypothetical protein SBA4_1280055 [Candidatus Sulfopaludibacter sp. SbA4]|nr:hypothetical protein SBA4_1280055 [Candidatus Sulfopaludibacter sp. SbA4]
MTTHSGPQPSDSKLPDATGSQRGEILGGLKPTQLGAPGRGGPKRFNLNGFQNALRPESMTYGFQTVQLERFEAFWQRWPVPNLSSRKLTLE